MNLKTFYFLFLIITILNSCQKKYPKPGEYNAVFNGVYEENGVKSYDNFTTIISETSKASFVIGLAKIDRCGNRFYGEIGGTGSYAIIELEGKTSKRSGKYFLKGSYTATDWLGAKITGEFEFKSI